MFDGFILAFRCRDSAKIRSTPGHSFEVWLYENGHNVTGSKQACCRGSQRVRPIHFPLRTLFGRCLPADFFVFC